MSQIKKICKFADTDLHTLNNFKRMQHIARCKIFYFKHFDILRKSHVLLHTKANKLRIGVLGIHCILNVRCIVFCLYKEPSLILQKFNIT